MIDTTHGRELAVDAVDRAQAAGAEQSEALFVASDHALTRFAGNRIHQNMASEDAELSVRAVIGTRVGVASTNRIDAEGVERCCRAATEAARLAPEDPAFPGLPTPLPAVTDDRVSASTIGFDADRRAAAAGAMIAESAASGSVAAGGVARDHTVVAIANSLGTGVAMARTSVRATVLSTAAHGGTGWAAFASRDAAGLDPVALGAFAADTARRSADPIGLDAGVYTVVLAPEAVADMALFIAWYGCSIKSVEEGRSFMSGKLGQRVTSPMITLVDDALAPWSTGLTFDYEGQPKTRVPLIERGVATSPVTDSYWAARTGRPNTGHALPAPNSQGPLPLDVALEAGDAEPSQLIASVKRGIYVTRFHYVNIEDPTRVTLTGMTRNGTFLIENGELTSPVKDLRFTQPALEALDTTLGVSAKRQLVGDEGTALVPYLLLERFRFTGQTS
ncbi:MAG TPA: TldD/PmbA family protein [Coriobacteriia bacterium]